MTAKRHLCMATGDDDVKYSIIWVVVTIVFAAIWSTIVVGRITSVMITSEISTPCA